MTGIKDQPPQRAETARHGPRQGSEICKSPAETTAAWPYQTEKTMLVPYSKSWKVFPDGLLGHLYLRTKQDERLEMIFDTGMDFDGFVSYFAKKTVAMQVYAMKEGPDLIPAGYCWVDDVVGRDGARRAVFGLCFFKEYRGRREVADLGWQSLKYWFTELKIDVLFGITMESNLQARNFARRYSFKEIGVMEKFMYRQGNLTSGRLVMLDRETFEPRYQRWLEERSVKG